MERSGSYFDSISGGKKLAARLAVVPFVWIPIALRPFLHDDTVNHTTNFGWFILIYLAVTALLYLLFTKILGNRKIKSARATGTCFALFFAQTVLLTLLYGSQLLTSLASLWITIPCSFAFTLVCVIPRLKKSEDSQ